MKDRKLALELLAFGMALLLIVVSLPTLLRAEEQVSSPGVPSPSVTPAQSVAQTGLMSPDVSVGTPTPHPTGGIGDPAFYFKPTPKPTVSVGAGIRGIASYYAYHPGQAAAGPALRRFLGPRWRGRAVRVWFGKAHIDVVLTDFCRCNTGKPKLIDLDIRDFAALRDVTRGTMMVTVTPLR